MKRRTTKWVSLGLLALIVGLALFLAIPPGRAALAWFVESLASDALHGDLGIGRIDGSLFSDLRVKDIVVRDENAHDVARVKAVRVEYDFIDLFVGRFRATSVTVDQPWVRIERLEDGRLNLETLIRSSPVPEVDPVPSTFEVVVDHFELRGGRVAQGPHGAAQTRVKDAGVRASATVVGPDLSVSLELAEGTVTNPEAHAQIEADIELAQDVLQIENLEIGVDDARVRVPRARLDLSSLALAAPIVARVPRGLVPKLTGVPGVDAAATVTATVTHGGGGEAWSAEIAGTVEGASIAASAKLASSFDEIDAELHIDALEVKRVADAAPGGRVSVDATARGPLANPVVTATIKVDQLDVNGAAFVRTIAVQADARDLTSAPTGRARLVARDARAGEVRFPLVQITATVGHEAGATAVLLEEAVFESQMGRFEAKPARLELDTDGRLVLEPWTLRSAAGNVEISAQVGTRDFSTQPSSAQLEITKLRIADLGALVAPQEKLQGVVDLSAKADVRDGRIDADVELHAKRLRRGAMAPTSVDAALHWKNRNVRAHIELMGDQLGRLTVTASATVPAEPLSPDAWRPPWDRLIDGLDVRANALKLDELGRAAGVASIEAGTLDARIRSASGLRALAAEVEVRSLRVRESAAPLNLSLEAETSSSKARMRADVELGARRRRVLSAEVGVTAGDDAIRKRGIADAFLQATTTASVTVHRTPLLEFTAALPEERRRRVAGLRGFASGNLSLRRGPAQPDDADLLLSIEDAVLQPEIPPVSWTLTASASGGQLSIRTGADSDVGEIRSRAAANVPADFLDAAGWKRLSERSARGGMVEVGTIDLATLATLGLLPESTQGTVSAAVTVGRGLQETRVKIRGRDVAVLDRFIPGDLDVTVEDHPDGLVFDVEASVLDSPLLAVKGRLDRSLRQLVELGDRVTAETSADVQITVDRFALSKLFRTRPNRPPVPLSGALTLDAQVRGLLEAPDATATFQVEKARLGGRRFERVSATAKWADERGRLRLDATQAKGQDLSVQAALDGLESPQIDATMKAENFVLDFIGPVLRALDGPNLALKGRMDADVVAHGRLSPEEKNVDVLPLPVGRIAVRNLRLLVTDQLPALESTLR